MINLLPKEEKKEVFTEYKIRFLTVFFAMISILAFCALVPLVASYFVISYNIGYVNDVANKLNESDSFKETASVVTKIKDANNKARILSLPLGTNARENIMGIMSSVFEIAKGVKGVEGKEEINLYQFSYDLLAKKAAASAGATTTEVQKESGNHRVLVRGKAVTREGFLSFLKKIENEKNFMSVDSPVSNIINSKNLDFMINIVLKDKSV